MKRVLIYRIGSLGDTIIALPCFHLIERTFPDAERILLTNFPIGATTAASASVLGGSGLVHGYMSYNVATRNPRELLNLGIRIRRVKPDFLIYLMPLRSPVSLQRDRLFFKIAGGVKRIVGFPDPKEQTRTPSAAADLYEAEATRLARSLTELGDAAANDPTNWDLRLSESEKRTARLALGDLADRPLIACGPGTKMQAKDWGRDNWRALLARLATKYPGYGLVLIGGEEDLEAGNFVSCDWRGAKVNLCGFLSPRETAAVLQYSSIFLGPDSGPMHMAACVGVPCVIAFSARGLPGVWYPFGQRHRIIYHQVNCFGCNLESCIVEARRCLTSITVQEMAEAVHSVLSDRSLEPVSWMNRVSQRKP